MRDLQVAAAERGRAYHLKAQHADELAGRIALLNQGYEAFDFNVLIKQLLAQFADIAPVELTDDEAREALEEAHRP